MATIIFRLVLGTLLIGSFAFYSYTSNPKYFLQFTSNKPNKDEKCPTDIRGILEKAGLEVTIDPICTQSKKIKYGITHAELINVAYGWTRGSDVIGQAYAPVLVVQEKEEVVLPREYTNDYWLMSYLEKELKTPFGGWTNFTTDNFAETNLIKRNSIYCLQYEFKFPFTGKLERCPQSSEDQPYEISGSVKYIEDTLQWTQAETRVSGECSKFGLQCKNQLSEWAREDPFAYWSGPHANSGLFIAGNGDLKNSYYVFAGGTYDKGAEGMILVKVFLNGTITSSLLKRSNYPADKLLKL